MVAEGACVAVDGGDAMSAFFLENERDRALKARDKMLHLLATTRADEGSAVDLDDDELERLQSARSDYLAWAAQWSTIHLSLCEQLRALEASP